MGYEGQHETNQTVGMQGECWTVRDAVSYARSFVSLFTHSHPPPSGDGPEGPPVCDRSRR